MKKIPTLFERDFSNSGHITQKVTKGCEWVQRGLGVPTFKYDGTAVKYHHGVWYVRRTVKQVDRDSYHYFMVSSDSRGYKNFPANFKIEEYDPVTQKAFGWVPATGDDREPYLVEALRKHCVYWVDGTFELVGPKINGNRQNLSHHALLRHGVPIEGYVPTGFNELYEYLRDFKFEGIVWYRVDGSMAKIKRRDFGLE